MLDLSTFHVIYTVEFLILVEFKLEKWNTIRTSKRVEPFMAGLPFMFSFVFWPLRIAEGKTPVAILKRPPPGRPCSFRSLPHPLVNAKFTLLAFVSLSV